MKKKICVITDHPVLENTGASLKIYYEYLKYFKDKYEVFHISFTTEKKLLNKKYNRSNFKQIFLPYENHLIPNKFSLICKMNNKKSIESILNKFSISTVVGFDIVVASQIHKIENVKKIIWLGDLRFQTNFYNFIFNLKSDLKLLRHFLYNFYQNFLFIKKYKEILKSVDGIVVSSKSSERILKNMGIDSKFLPYPWPRIFSKVKMEKVKKPNYLFFGNLSGLGSKSALYMLFKKIYPLLVKKKGHNNFSINLVGHASENSFLKNINIKKFPEIKYYGFVKNLNKVSSNSSAVIFPGNIPVGNRCRLVSCMASKMPIVAHESVKEGNPFLIDGYSAYLSRNSSDFVNKMILAVTDNEIKDNIVNNAYRLYRENYFPVIASKKLDRFVHEKIS
tara:strand:- start:58486 stop:59661 length:1176 start_codon:yes stop_codon:yes gene_type:complete